jgi:hypothetical protein
MKNTTETPTDFDGIYDQESLDKIHDKQVELVLDLAVDSNPVFLIGGYACDLLLDNSLDGQHKDVDMVVSRDWQDQLGVRLKSLGYKIGIKKKTDHAKVYKYFLKDSDLVQADFPFIDIDSDSGELYFEEMLKDGRLVRLYFSPDAMLSDPIQMSGKSVRVLSPRAIIQSLLYYAQIGLNEVREQDQLRAKKLMSRYFPGEVESSELFKVRVEIMPS